MAPDTTNETAACPTWTLGSTPDHLPNKLSDPLATSPPVLDPHPSYLDSSQARHWTFSPSTLTSLRTDKHRQVSESILQFVSDSEQEKRPNLLGLDDEIAIIRFYLLRIGRIVKALGLPSLIEATAMTFMKRFYLRNSCMQFHPKLIMLTSIYLASKSENYPLHLTHFCAQVNKSTGASNAQQNALVSSPSAVRGDVTESILSDLEFGMVLSLHFELGVHGAQRALYGFILDIQTIMPQITREDLLAFAGSVQPYLHFSRLTDAEFLYAPTHIALASCWMCRVTPESSSAKAVLDGRDIVMTWLKAKEQQGLRVFEQRRAEREAWRQKQQTFQHKPSSFAPEEIREDVKDKLDANKHPLVLSLHEITSVLDDIAEMIRCVITIVPGVPPKPSMDMERVKQIDLDLRGCLAAFDAMQQTQSRKRAADDDDEAGQAKRIKTSIQESDSD